MQSFHNLIVRSQSIGAPKNGEILKTKELIGISNRSSATTIDNAIHKIYPRLIFNSYRSTVIRPTTMKRFPAILVLVALCFASEAFGNYTFATKIIIVSIFPFEIIYPYYRIIFEITTTRIIHYFDGFKFCLSFLNLNLF